MNRRESILALLALGAAPLTSLAQQAGKVWRIGFLAGGSRPASLESSLYAGFTTGMRELGYVEGKNFVMEWRFAEGKYDRFPDLAVELVRLKVDVLVLGTGAAGLAAKRATAVIPIVIGSAYDAVGQGLVSSLSRPGGNVTGVSATIEETAKFLELLKIIAPGATRVAVLGNPLTPAYSPILESVQIAGRKLNVTILPVPAQNREQIDRSFDQIKHERAQGLIVPSDAFILTQRFLISEFAMRNKLPSMFSQPEYVEAGGLMSYGQALSDYYRFAATYVDKILKGAKPGDLPLEQPTKFDFVINLKTAKALGIKIPQELLLRADHLIE